MQIHNRIAFDPIEPASPFVEETRKKQRKRSPSSRYRRTIPIPLDRPLSAGDRHDLLQLLTNNRTDLAINSAAEGARLLILEVIVQALIDLLNKKATPVHRRDALDFFLGEAYVLYMNMLDLDEIGFPQAIEVLLLQSDAISDSCIRREKP
jgi:hypothetical protein